ncbi:hypothetical protein [Soonwooa sp.]|uniref:hypothetical protein n=1 Tax=Soonwooa sp. TaxID=1938592 RepID=UPI0028AA5599|nr:hypothetical protein [Soonwooa sp.]
MAEKDKDPLEMLEKEKEVILWQLSFAQDRDVIQRKKDRLKVVEDQIRDLTIQYNAL